MSNNEKIKMNQEIEQFIRRNRKICWESEFENGEFCIGEDAVQEFCRKIVGNMLNNGQGVEVCDATKAKSGDEAGKQIEK